MNVHSQPERGAARREAILAAALELFCERGFHGTAVPEIAAAAGVATGTIYRHFDGKEALVNTLYRRHKQALVAAVLEDFPFDAPARSQLAVFWRRIGDFARREPRAFAFLELHHHAPYLDDESRALEEGALAPMVAFVQRAAAAGIVRDAPPEALIALVWGAFVGLVRAWQAGYLELSDEILSAAEQSVWDAIAARTEP